MKIDIKMKNGKWVVNGKTYKDLDHEEKKFMDEFFKNIKITTMKTLISFIAIITLTSCSISKGVKVIGFTGTSIITVTNDTIPARERLLRLMVPGEFYNLHMLNDRCVDASWPSKKRREKLSKTINQ